MILFFFVPVNWELLSPSRGNNLSSEESYCAFQKLNCSEHLVSVSVEPWAFGFSFCRTVVWAPLAEKNFASYHRASLVGAFTFSPAPPHLNFSFPPVSSSLLFCWCSIPGGDNQGARSRAIRHVFSRPFRRRRAPIRGLL
jgi:hypothetical protein